MADIPVKRERQIDQMINQLGSSDPAERRAAAYWLGEAAAADAVPQLVDLYEHDENASVRRAAGYALGMFRAVEVAIKKGKEKRVVRLLEQVEQKGKLGRRANKGGWMRLVLGLLLSLVVLALAYQFAPVEAVRAVQTTLARAGLFRVEPETERDSLLSSLRQHYVWTRDDATTLQTQFQSRLGGGAFDCSVYFNNRGQFQLLPADAFAYPDIAQLVTRLNAAQSSYAAAYTRFDQACLETTPLPPEEVGATYAMLVSAIQALPEIETALTAAERNEPLVTPTAQATATSIAPTAAPTSATPPPPTTAISIANPRSHLPALYGIIANVTGQRGALQLLLQYWGDSLRAQNSAACSTTPPAVPSNYELPEADAQASPDLAQAVDSLNSALDTIRTSWTNFTFACNSGNLTAVAQQEQAIVLQAQAAIQAAEQLLNRVRDDV